MKTKNITLIIVLVVLTMGIGLFIWQKNSTQQTAVNQGHHDKWYCPMHPWILYDHPGRCPICGMDLVKRVFIAHEQTPELKGYTTISVSAQKQEMIGLQIESVEVKPVVKLIRTFGTIASDAELYQTQSEFIDAYVAYVNVFRDYKKLRDRRHIWESHRDLQTHLLDTKDKLLKLGLRGN